MSNFILPSYNNRVRYTLRNTVFGTTRITEPLRWKEDNKVFKRSLKSHGVFISLSSKNITFYVGGVLTEDDVLIEGGFNYIEGVYQQQGVNADIILIKEERNPQTDVWEESYRGFLDLSTREVQHNQISVQFNESGLNAALKARQSEKLNLGRLTTMDGDTISALTRQTVALDGRNIFLVSALKLNEQSENPLLVPTTLSKPIEARALPLTLLSESDDSVQSITDLFVDEITTSYDSGKSSHQFYNVADKDKTLSITFDIDYDISSASIGDYRLDLVTYENGSNYDFKSFQTLKSFRSTNAIMQFNDTIEVPLLAGESLTLSAHNSNISNISYNWNKTDVKIEEDSFVDASQAEFVLPFEALERIIHITTGEEDALVSNFLGRTDLGNSSDGEGSLTGITNGFLIRRIEDKDIQTSYKDFDQSFSAIWSTGYGIEKIGFKEVVRFEELKYFYQDTVTIRLPNQAKDIKRTVAKDRFFSGLEHGFKKGGGDYEEAMGLDEYNNKNTYTTVIKRIQKVFSKLSTYRADSYGMEFARRKSVLTNPVEDTRYDDDIFAMDLKRGLTSVFEQRLWQDDFAKAPAGVFSSDTAQNLRFSPFNCLLRWGWWIRAGLNVYPNSLVSFSSSTGNSELSTQLIGEDEVAENGSVTAGSLEKSRHQPEIIEFEHEVTTDILQSLQAKTIINGEEVTNYYGQIEFINENGNKEAGFLLEVKPNGAGKWKLIKANKPIIRVL